MTLVKFKNSPAQRPFNNFIDDFFAQVPSIFRDDFQTPQFSVPVNVKETGEGFELEVVAPGFNKEDLVVNIEKNVLTVSTEKKNSEQKENEKQIRKEYQFRSFKRSFTLDDTIDASAIAAQYVNGVLTLNLPRKAAVKEAVKQITIQ